MPNSDASPFAQTSLRGIRRHYYEFGPFRVDALNQRLLRDGEPVAITPKALDLLLVLLQNRERVVTKVELMNDLWGDTAVEEANLTQQVFTLRKVLGESAGGAAYIETVPRRGYRLAADVREMREEPTQSPGSTAPPSRQAEPEEKARARGTGSGSRRPVRPFAALALLIALAGVLIAWKYWRIEPSTRPVTLAVMPFENLSVQPGEQRSIDFATSLAIGIPDAIITRLSNVRQFRVRPTSAVAQFHGKAVDAQEVGRRLDSQYVLLGTIRAGGDRVRVSVQLVRAADGSPVWGRQYDTAREDLLGIEDAVAEEISSALRIQMSDAERERLYRRYTRSGAAYERYLMGRARLRSLTEQDALQAIREFEAARDLDPGYALAYAGLASAASQLRVRFASAKGDDVWDAGPPGSWPRAGAGSGSRRGARGARSGAPLPGIRLGHGDPREPACSRAEPEPRRAASLHGRRVLPHRPAGGSRGRGRSGACAEPGEPRRTAGNPRCDQPVQRTDRRCGAVSLGAPGSD
jgi:DNA-binding winged helix-turn-helix (wHTH) protein/TolB-like protein